MILDKEEHRAMLLELIDKTHFPGIVAKRVVELVDAITNAVARADGEPAAKPANVRTVSKIKAGKAP